MDLLRPISSVAWKAAKPLSTYTGFFIHPAKVLNNTGSVVLAAKGDNLAQVLLLLGLLQGPLVKNRSLGFPTGFTPLDATSSRSSSLPGVSPSL